MAEHPVKLQRGRALKKQKKQLSKITCIIHFPELKTDKIVRNLSAISFNKIKESASLRQSQEDATVRLDDICSELPDNLNENLHGIHRQCYQKFTNISNIKKRKIRHEEDEDAGPSTSKRKRTASSAILFPHKCLFCDRVRKDTKGVTEYLTKCVTQTAAKSIEEEAKRRKDEVVLQKILGLNLVAREAKYHNTCRRDYTRSESRHESKQPDTDVAKNLEAHKKAFAYICDYVEKHIIKGCCVERVTMLREKYLQFLQEYFPTAYNKDYKTDKLKDKLKKHFGLKIKFWRPNYRSELIYSEELPTGQAVEAAFEMAASEEKFLREAATVLRRLLIDARKNGPDLSWPPSASELLSSDLKPPQVLTSFLAFLLCGKPLKDVSGKMERLVDSCAQDICFALSRGEWKMPKHVALGMTLRHLTGSAEIITIMNRFGHCQSYTQIMELETAICNELVAQESLLPPTISPARNIVLHFSWDNFDLDEETTSGGGTTHVAHGIVIQETTPALQSSTVEAQVAKEQQKKTKERSIHYETKQLPPCFVKGKKEPHITVKHSSVETPDSALKRKEGDFAWILFRYQNSEGQTIPGWAGWVSATEESEYVGPNTQSIVDYMVPIHRPITDNATVQELLRICQQATKSVDQECTIVTFDLAVVMKAYAIIWQNPKDFSDVLVRIGVFHTICSYLGALGKRMTGSGFEDIIIESGICASGSIGQVLRGKHYNRAMRVHKLMFESLERLLLETFLSSSNHKDALNASLQGRTDLFRQTPSPQELNELLSSESFQELFNLYCTFKDKIREGDLGKTAMFWLNYMDKVALLLQFSAATRLNDLDLHISSLWDMCPTFFAYNHHNYAHYVPVYLLTLLNICETHPGAELLLRKNGFSVSRSEVKSSRNPVDLTIEETINRHAKSRCGIIGFSRNPAAYNRWCMTRHARATFLQATYDMADMTSPEHDTHKEMRKSQKEKSESDVQSLVESFKGFLNPFDIDMKDELVCLSSGAPASKKIQEDLLNADEIGKKAFQDFVRERCVDKSVSFHKPIQRKQLDTFEAMNEKKKVTSASNKHLEVKAERNLFGQLVMLSEENNISLKKTLAYPLSPVPWALATPDGNPVKTDKAKLLHSLEAGSTPASAPKAEDTIYVIDGNAVLQSITALPASFADLAKSVFDLLPKVPRVDFVTDTYKKQSIKSHERSRRGSSQTFLVKGPNTKVPRDWKGFMSNDTNKEQLIKLLLSEWKTDKYAAKLFGRIVYYVCGEECFQLTSHDGQTVECVPEESLFSSQEEADTRIILHCLNIAKVANQQIVIITRSPDTDVLVLLLKFHEQIPHILLFDTGVGNKRRLLNVKDIAAKHGPEFCEVLPSLHAFSGCDTTSAFVRRGKITPKKTLIAHPQFTTTFHKLGEALDVSTETCAELERFVCCMYGKPAYSDVNKLRYDMFKQKFQPKKGQTLSTWNGIDLSLLPPSRPSLSMHILRSNYQAYIWNRSQEQYPDIPSPDGNGWKVNERGELEIDWVKGDILPRELLDILPEEDVDSEDIDMDTEIEINNLDDIIYDEES